MWSHYGHHASHCRYVFSYMHACYMLNCFFNISKFPSIAVRLIGGLYGVKRNSDLQYLQCWQLATSRPFYVSFFCALESFWQESDTTWPTRFQISAQKLIFGPESKTSSERMRKMERRSVHSLYNIFHCSRSIPLFVFLFVCVCVSSLFYCFVCLFCYYFFLFFIFSPEFTVLKRQTIISAETSEICVWCSGINWWFPWFFIFSRSPIRHF